MVSYSAQDCAITEIFVFLSAFVWIDGRITDTRVYECTQLEWEMMLLSTNLEITSLGGDSLK